MQSGSVTGRVKTRDTSKEELAQMMVGREVVFRVEKPPAKPTETVLKIENLHAYGDRGLPALREVSFSVRRGEIVGIAGVEGNGQAELVEVITGLRDITGGIIEYNGRDIANFSPRERRELGLSHIPADRLSLGVNTKCTIEENLILNKYYTNPLSNWSLIQLRKVKRFSEKLMEAFEIMAPSSETLASSLSGGNMQKVVLARELESDPDLLIASQPTRGVDIGAIEYIHNLIIELRDRGSGVVLVSTELDEILSLSDRILVLYEGEIVGEFTGDEVTEEDIGLYLAGAKQMEIH
jgi:simple sugar transport system ATP-binding protein